MFDAAGAATAIDAATERAGQEAADAAMADPQPSSDAAGAHPTGGEADGAQVLQVAAPAINHGRKEAVFVDGALADRQDLIGGLGAGVEIVQLDGGRDGLAQIAAWAATHADFDAVHVISHGAEGKVFLGTATLDATTVESRAEDLATIGGALTDSGDLLLYGCSVASGSGRAFADALARATGADVAASTDRTGAGALGGDWDLEYAAGPLESRAFALPYGHLLGEVTDTMDGASVDGSDTTILHSSITVNSTPIAYTITQGDGLNWTNVDSFTADTAYVPGAVFAAYDVSFSADGTSYTFAFAQAVSIVSINMMEIDAATNTSCTYTFTDTTGGSSNSPVSYTANNLTSINGGFEALSAMLNWTAVETFTVTITRNPGDHGGYLGFDNLVVSDAPAGLAVTDGHISVTSTGSGTGGAYRAGDTITAQWNNSGTGDNNSGVTGVTMDFSAFGGGAAVTASNSGGVWTASYTLGSGSIDATNLNVSVTATDGTPVTTADTTNLTVDTQAPTVTDANVSLSGATGSGGVYKIGDIVTATWNNTASGDNNGDIAAVSVDFTAFGGGTVAASDASGTWTASYTIVSGSTEASGRNVSVTATDDAGNATTVADTTGATLDNQAPGSASGSLTVAENAANDTAVGSVSASGGVSYSLTDTAGGRFALGSGGALTVANGSLLDYETNTSHNITVRATDSVGNVTDTVLSVTVTNVNEDPAVAALPASVTVSEDILSGVNLSALTLSDPDSGSNTITLTITAANGIVGANNVSGSVTGSGLGTSTLTLTGTVAALDTWLNTPTNLLYRGTANTYGVNADTLTITANDGGHTGAGGGTDVTLGTVQVDITGIADTPSVTNAVTADGVQSTSGLVISRNAADGAEVTHFKITAITGGTLYKADGSTQITNGTFITYAEGQAGLKFTPSGSSGGSFNVEASTDGSSIAGSAATATIGVGIAVDSPTILEDAASETIAITGDGTASSYKITAITHGTLYSDSGLTTEISDGSFIATAGASTPVYFVPDANFNGTASFVVQGSTDGTDGGLVGSAKTSTITVTAQADAPTISGLGNQTFGQNALEAGFQKIAPTIVIADPDAAEGGQYFARLQVDNTATDQNWYGALWVDTDGTGIDIQADYQLYVDNVHVGTIGGGGDGGILDFVLNGNATLAVVQTLAENVMYRNTSDAPHATQTFSFRVEDGTAQSTTQTMAVTITPENEAPRNRSAVDMTTLDAVESQEIIPQPNWWYIDRKAVDGFANATFDGRQSIHVTVGNESTDGFYGYKHEIDAATRISGDLYLDSAWASNGAVVRPGLWGVGLDDSGDYDHGNGEWPSWPILEYNKDVGDFRAWDDDLGWVNMGLPGDADADSWYGLSIAVGENGRFVFTVEGTRAGGTPFTLSYTSSVDSTVTAFHAVILNARADTTTSYDAYWSKLTVNSGDAATSSVLATASVAEGATVAIGGLAVVDGNGDTLTTVLTTTKGTLTATAGGGAVLSGAGTGTLSLSGTAAQINAALSGLSFTAAADAVGTATITMTTTDGAHLSDSDTISVTVAFANDAPVAGAALPAQTASENGAFTYTVPGTAFSDADADDTLTYSASLASNGALPSWLSFNAATRTFSGTPAKGDAGTLAVKITATDGSNATASQSFELTVTPVNDAPTNPTAPTLATITEDAASPARTVSSLLAGVTDGDGDPLGIAVTALTGHGTWQYSTDAGATWTAMTVSSSSGARLLSGAWTIRYLADGLHGETATLSYRAWDKTTGTAGGTADASAGGGTSAFSAATATLSQAVTEVNDSPAAQGGIANVTTPAGASWSYTVPASLITDPDGETLTWTARTAGGGALPTWLHFDAATRTFSGTAQTLPATGIVVTATDGSNASASVTFTLTVPAPATPPATPTTPTAPTPGQGSSGSAGSGAPSQATPTATAPVGPPTRTSTTGDAGSPVLGSVVRPTSGGAGQGPTNTNGALASPVVGQLGSISDIDNSGTPVSQSLSGVGFSTASLTDGGLGGGLSDGLGSTLGGGLGGGGLSGGLGVGGGLAGGGLGVGGGLAGGGLGGGLGGGTGIGTGGLGGGGFGAPGTGGGLGGGAGIGGGLGGGRFGGGAAGAGPGGLGPAGASPDGGTEDGGTAPAGDGLPQGDDAPTEDAAPEQGSDDQAAGEAARPPGAVPFTDQLAAARALPANRATPLAAILGTYRVPGEAA
jgi:hypothetical protein